MATQKLHQARVGNKNKEADNKSVRAWQRGFQEFDNDVEIELYDEELSDDLRHGWPGLQSEWLTPRTHASNFASPILSLIICLVFIGETESKHI